MRSQVTKKIVVLANSQKFCESSKKYGRLVAGATKSGEWIRLVEDESGDALPQFKAMRMAVGKVIEVTVLHAPLAHQTENAILLDCVAAVDNPDEYTRNIQLVDEDGIFGNSSNQLRQAPTAGTLRYVHVENLRVYWDNSFKCKADFIFKGERHEGLSMTDSRFYTPKGSSPVRYGNAQIVVSLPDSPIYNKFVASIKLDA
ncbi:MAG: hypothetical protein LBT59_30170 [Clostridiales bacterium]|jgi:hypothetical protein|nr:hypothetical protein [Clostridiales bacterium]